MSYNPFTWQNAADGNTPITATRLNAIEQGISDAALTADQALAAIGPTATFGTNTALIVVDATGTRDYFQDIQDALDDGSNVTIVGVSGALGIAMTSATLVMNVNTVNQVLLTQNACIAPNFVGDVVQVTTKSQVSVAIRGTKQPTSGSYTAVAAIRVGGHRAGDTADANPYSPQQAAVTYCDIRNFSGSGIAWDNGRKIDFTGTYVANVSVDGFTMGPKFTDNDMGYFANTNVVSAGRYGYATLYGGNFVTATAGSAGYASNYNQFLNAKASSCGQNFHFETSGNIGTVFSELGGTADAFTATSRANYIEVLGASTAFEAWVDQGAGNSLDGYGTGDVRISRNSRTRSLQLGTGAPYTAVTSGTYTIPTTTIAANGVAAFNPNVSGLGVGWVVRATLFTPTGGGNMLNAYIDTNGTLRFELFNLTAASKNLSGIVTYDLWRMN